MGGAFAGNGNTGRSSIISTDWAFLFDRLAVVPGPLSTLGTCVSVTRTRKSVPVSSKWALASVYCSIASLTVPIWACNAWDRFTSWVLIVPCHSSVTVGIYDALSINFIWVQGTETGFTDLIVSFWTNTTHTVGSVPLLVCWTFTGSQKRTEHSIPVTQDTIISVEISVGIGTSAFGPLWISRNRSTWNTPTVQQVGSFWTFTSVQVWIPAHSILAVCSTNVSVPQPILAFALTCVRVVKSPTCALNTFRSVPDKIGLTLALLSCCIEVLVSRASWLAWVAVPGCAWRTDTWFRIRLEVPSPIAGNASESVPYRTNRACTCSGLRIPDLTTGTSYTCVPIPFKVIWTVTVVIDPNLTCSTSADTMCSIPNLILWTLDTSVSVESSLRWTFNDALSKVVHWVTSTVWANTTDENYIFEWKVFPEVIDFKVENWSKIPRIEL